MILTRTTTTAIIRSTPTAAWRFWKRRKRTKIVRRNWILSHLGIPQPQQTPFRSRLRQTRQPHGLATRKSICTTFNQIGWTPAGYSTLWRGSWLTVIRADVKGEDRYRLQLILNISKLFSFVSSRPFSVQKIPHSNLILLVVDTLCPCGSKQLSITPYEVMTEGSSCRRKPQETMYRRRPPKCFNYHPEVRLKMV